MKETLKISDRFKLVKKLGQGAFSNFIRFIQIFNDVYLGYIYEAYDK